MGTTANYAWPYPASSAPVEVWSDIQALAVAADSTVKGLADVVAGIKSWTTFTPTLFNNQISGTPAAVTKTVTRAGYWRLGTGAGSIIIAQAEVVLTAAAANGLSIGLPVTASERWLMCGTAVIAGASPPTQAGHAYMGAALDRLHIVSNTNAFQSAVSGDGVRYLAIYKAAS